MLPCSRLSNNGGLLEVVSAVAEEWEACCHALDSLTTMDLDVVEVASAVEELSEVVCHLQLHHSQHTMTMDGSDAVCCLALDSSTVEEFNVASTVEKESESACCRHCRIENAAKTDKSYICHEGGR